MENNEIDRVGLAPGSYGTHEARGTAAREMVVPDARGSLLS